MTLTYPLVVACVAVFVLVILSFVTISVYRSIFMDFGIELPLLTKAVLAMAMFLTSRWALVALAGLVALIAILANAGRVFSKQFLEWFSYRFGAMFGRATGLAQFTRYVAELLRAGVDVPQSLRVAGFAARHARVRQASWQLADDIEHDRPPRSSQLRVLTTTVLHALRSDCPPASRIELLNEISRCYADQAGDRLSWTRGMIEPITICVVGVIVGTTVIALFLPLVRLVNALSG
jgi:type IV pilus assembly protein PilC